MGAARGTAGTWWWPKTRHLDSAPPQKKQPTLHRAHDRGAQITHLGNVPVVTSYGLRRAQGSGPPGKGREPTGAHAHSRAETFFGSILRQADTLPRYLTVRRARHRPWGNLLPLRAVHPVSLFLRQVPRSTPTSHAPRGAVATGIGTGSREARRLPPTSHQCSDVPLQTRPGRPRRCSGGLFEADV